MSHTKILVIYVMILLILGLDLMSPSLVAPGHWNTTSDPLNLSLTNNPMKRQGFEGTIHFNDGRVWDGVVVCSTYDLTKSKIGIDDNMILSDFTYNVYYIPSLYEEMPFNQIEYSTIDYIVTSTTNFDKVNGFGYNNYYSTDIVDITSNIVHYIDDRDVDGTNLFGVLRIIYYNFHYDRPLFIIFFSSLLLLSFLIPLLLKLVFV